MTKLLSWAAYHSALGPRLGPNAFDAALKTWLRRAAAERAAPPVRLAALGARTILHLGTERDSDARI